MEKENNKKHHLEITICDFRFYTIHIQNLHLGTPLFQEDRACPPYVNGVQARGELYQPSSIIRIPDYRPFIIRITRFISNLKPVQVWFSGILSS